MNYIGLLAKYIRNWLSCVTSMESAKLIAGNQDKLTKSVFINIIDTDFCCQSVTLKVMD